MKQTQKHKRHWYWHLLKMRSIDYWSFNAFVRKPKPKYQLFAARTLQIAKRLGLHRIREIDGIYYGIMKLREEG